MGGTQGIRSLILCASSLQVCITIHKARRLPAVFALGLHTFLPSTPLSPF
jgi:hypothetical protein